MESIIKLIADIAPVIAPVITGFGGVYFGHKLAASRIKQEINELEEKDKRVELRHKEEKFENAIQDWALDGLFKDLENKYEDFSISFNSWKSKHKNEHSTWLRKHKITELNDFYSWMAKRCEDTNCEQCWINFWNAQKK